MNEIEFDKAFDEFLDSELCEREVAHISKLFLFLLLTILRPIPYKKGNVREHNNALIAIAILDIIIIFLGDKINGITNNRLYPQE